MRSPLIHFNWIEISLHHFNFSFEEKFLFSSSSYHLQFNFDKVRIIRQVVVLGPSCNRRNDYRHLHLHRHLLRVLELAPVQLRVLEPLPCGSAASCRGTQEWRGERVLRSLAGTWTSGRSRGGRSGCRSVPSLLRRRWSCWSRTGPTAGKVKCVALEIK